MSPYFYGVVQSGANFVGPLDAYTANLSLAFSATNRLLTSYLGYAFNVRRSSDSTTMDIGFNADGTVNTTALLAFAGAGSAFITKFYNQSTLGAAFDYKQINGANQPRIVNAGVLDDGIYFNGSSYFLEIDSAVASSYTSDGTHLQVVQTGMFIDGRNFDFGPDQLAAWNVFSGSIYMDIPYPTARISVAAPVGYTSSYNNVSFERNGGTSTIRVNGSSLTSGGVSGLVAGTSTLRLGCSATGTNFFSGNVRHFVIWSDCTNPATRAAALP